MIWVMICLLVRLLCLGRYRRRFLLVVAQPCVFCFAWQKAGHPSKINDAVRGESDAS
jgi:hypothetical protein